MSYNPNEQRAHLAGLAHAMEVGVDLPGLDGFNERRAANAGPVLKPFTVRIGPRGAPRLEFGAMSRSSVECFTQHVDLCEVGERCEIVAAGVTA